MWWAPEYACCRDAWRFQGDWTNKKCLSRGVQIWWDINSQDALSLSEHNSGETDEANCSWLHPIWPPPRRPDRDSKIYVVNRTFTKLILCINRVFDVRDSVFKPHCIVWERCRDISGWKSRVMRPTVLGGEANCRAAFAEDEANWVWMKPTPHCDDF